METGKMQTERKPMEKMTSTVTTKMTSARKSSHLFIHHTVVTPTALTKITSEHLSAPSLSLPTMEESTIVNATAIETSKNPNLLPHVSREEQTTHLPSVDRRSQTQLLPSTASNETSSRKSTSFHPSASPMVSRTNTSAATVSPPHVVILKPQHFLLLCPARYNQRRSTPRLVLKEKRPQTHPHYRRKPRRLRQVEPYSPPRLLRELRSLLLS
ncbi:hypothetical protein V3C99_009285 [Haemonchus contortus]